MSIFQRIFGGSKKGDSNVTPQQAIQRLSSMEDVLVKKQEHLEAQIETEKGNAIRLSKQGNKRGALTAMKKKKQYEKALLQVDGTLTTLESQREALQNASSNMEVFKAIKQGAKALEVANQGVDADTIHDLKDDMDEQFSLADEISAAISSPGLRASDGISEEDLLAELEDLAADEDNQAVIRNGPLPVVPVTSTQKKIKEKDFSERELEAWMNS